MLREMGIEAEAVVVSSQVGDAVPTMLPMPAAFDHVIVHAVIDGTDYWLDGTSSGASMDVVGEVPDFHVALPLRDGGADLMPMPQRPQKSFDQVARITLDHRAGPRRADALPGRFHADRRGRGAVPFGDRAGGRRAARGICPVLTSPQQLGESSLVDSKISVR